MVLSDPSNRNREKEKSSVTCESHAQRNTFRLSFPTGRGSFPTIMYTINMGWLKQSDLKKNIYIYITKLKLANKNTVFV